MMHPPPTPEPVVPEERRKSWLKAVRDLFSHEAEEIRSSWTDSATALKKHRKKNRARNRTARESRRVQMARFRRYHG